MNKQIYAVLSLVCGLLGFNLIAIAQTMSYMQISNYLTQDPNLDVTIFAIGGTYKLVCGILGVLALVLCFLYTKSPDNSARLFNSLGGILGLITVVLGLIPVYEWLI